MEENKDKKREDSGKLQLKKTFNVGQMKQSFSHGRTRSVSVVVKKKRVLRGLGDEAGLTKKLFKEENDHEIVKENHYFSIPELEYLMSVPEVKKTVWEKWKQKRRTIKNDLFL